VTGRSARWPWLAFGAFGAIAGLGIPLTISNGTGVADDLVFVVAFGMFGLVGALIASRDPGNRIGLLFLWASLAPAVGFCSTELVTFLHDRGSRGGTGAAVLAVLGDAAWIIGILPVLVLLPLLFPDGELPSRRWRPVLWLIFVTLALVFVALILGSRTLTGSAEQATFENPFHVPVISSVAEPIEGAFFPIFIGILAACVVSLILRFRRSGGVERQQIKWFALAVVFLLSVITLSEILLAFGIESPLFDILLVAPAFLFLPVTVGIAVLRYRLYDLDVVVRKTLLYGLLVAIATGVYVVVVVGVGTLVGRESPFLTMVAAVIVAVGFQPARVRLTHVANRIVYGKRATPYEVLAEFSERVGEAYAADDVLPRMARVVAEGVKAEHADVWLKIGDELRVSASWPSGNGRGTTRLPLTKGSMPQIHGADVAYPVEHRGELLGALAVTKPVAEPITPNDAKLVQDLASQAGLVLRNVRLTEELRARLDDLRAAQRRIVSAQDEARRRLERNIHDGAQQQLVALSVKARLAKGLAEKDPAKAVDILGQLESDTTDALENLRDLARGIYPPLLADKGLTAALEAQARKALVPVEVEADGVGRYPQDVEAATYFSVLEAVQNTAKHADASLVRIVLRHAEDELSFDVVDDGVGFDPATTGYGTGLQGIADRLTAQDGALEIRSAPGGGTAIAGRIPLKPV
jgi:signal transduction histidine kinase